MPTLCRTGRNIQMTIAQDRGYLVSVAKRAAAGSARAVALIPERKASIDRHATDLAQHVSSCIDCVTEGA